MANNAAQLLLLDRYQAAALLRPDEVLASVRAAFLLHAVGEGRNFPLVREALPQGVFGIKSGGVARMELLGMKAAGFWPGNRRYGADGHQATIMLFDPASGRPQCLIDGVAVTTERTAAAGALGLLALARPDSAALCVFGTGVQGGAQLDYALRALPGLRTVRYRTSDGRRDAKFEARFAQRCDIAPGGGADAMVADSDIVITATTGRGPLFSPQAVRPGTHLNCVGSDTRGKRELPAGLLARASVWVDDLTQALAIGELQWAPQTPGKEFGDLLAAGGPARQGVAAGAVTIFDMTGIALQDLLVARMLQQRAVATGTGTSVAWPWQ
ncbi:ornithine cyclodeaminase family protein [Duganella sp. BJB488]|nr:MULTISPECIES: ornithine cyclodeaminase family protein [unclassified Duganella]NVD70297.1 ornithine cyclodeaminase family protein [Duganella sp. BJB1802]RFP23231.1 ornithine cyclodeaminase family protein [Duganella sp. BJB489]RFP25116.1 ornithine cyclodeaminase family protein [Duganella sp. BJB488]RFP34231.1 ornithine cyclodeaminase family protein [Duganella sp. BJB480]